MWSFGAGEEALLQVDLVFMFSRSVMRKQWENTEMMGIRLSCLYILDGYSTVIEILATMFGFLC